MALIYHCLSWLNKTTSLEKNRQFEGSLPGARVPFEANAYPGPVSCKKNKRQLLQKIPTVTAKSLWIKQREGRPAEWNQQKTSFLQWTLLSISNAAQHMFWVTFTYLTGEPCRQKLSAAARWAAKNFLISEGIPKCSGDCNASFPPNTWDYTITNLTSCIYFRKEARIFYVGEIGNKDQAGNLALPFCSHCLLWKSSKSKRHGFWS